MPLGLADPSAIFFPQRIGAPPLQRRRIVAICSNIAFIMYGFVLDILAHLGCTSAGPF